MNIFDLVSKDTVNSYYANNFLQKQEASKLQDSVNKNHLPDKSHSRVNVNLYS